MFFYVANQFELYIFAVQLSSTQLNIIDMLVVRFYTKP
jgi:hypothetical protein